MAEPKTLPGPHRNSVSTSYTASAGGTGENERKNQFPHPHSESEETLGVVLSHHLPATLGLGLGTDRRYRSGKGNHSRNKTHSPAVVNTGFRVKSRRYPDSLLPLNSLRGLASTTLPASAPSSTELSTLALQGCCTVRFHTALNTGPHSRKRL